jgi:predicted dinucleotide-binding enzyme
MKIAVLGTGMVGNTIASKLVQLGHAISQPIQSARRTKAWRKGATTCVKKPTMIGVAFLASRR